MKKESLILHIPVIHRGFLDFLQSRKENIGEVYIIDGNLLMELTQFKPDIASLEPQEVKQLLGSLGFSNISILGKENIQDVKGKDLLLIQDEVSRKLYAKYLNDQKVGWISVFLRWDKSLITSELSLENIPTSQDSFDKEMIEEAYKEAEKSSDWWRHIGAVLVKDRLILIRSYNQDLPSDHTPYQTGEVRDFFKAGERQDLANTIHAEQNIIAKAAKNGIALQGTSLYATHFPCPVCAKLIACCGIKSLYFSEGASIFDGKKVLESASVSIVFIPKSDKI